MEGVILVPYDVLYILGLLQLGCGCCWSWTTNLVYDFREVKPVGSCNFRSEDAMFVFDLLDQLVERGYIFLLLSHLQPNLLLLVGEPVRSFWSNLVSKDENYFVSWSELDNTFSKVIHDQFDI